MNKIELRAKTAGLGIGTSKTMDEKDVMTKPKNLLEAFENIVELSEGSKLDAPFMVKATVPIKYAARKLKLTPMQTVLLAQFVDRSEDNGIRLSEIASYTGCRTTRILRLMPDVEVLEKLHYIRAARVLHTLSFRVPSDVL